MSQDFDPEKTYLGPTNEAHTSHSVDDDEHEEHIDERWLVSYADMMTLLFGLFVLLYSLSVMDKNAAEKVIQSTKEKFGEASKTDIEPPKIDPQVTIESLEKQKLELEEKLRLQSERYTQEQEDLKKEMDQQLKEVEKLSALNKNLQATSQELERWTKKAKDLEQKISQDSSKQLINKLEAQLLEQKSKQANDQNLKEKMDQIRIENTNLKQLLDKNKRDLSSVDQNVEKMNQLASQIQQLQSKNEDLQKNNATLETKLKQAENLGGAQKAFLAVFISWSTRDHDIDLVIKDPSGKKFDFKNRKHSSHPGYFALDTRRGPGAELWQTDRILPGIYTATYSFYNQYGNTEPAKVSGTIYSAKGSFEISSVQMDVSSKKEYLIKFDVKEDGSVNILNMKH